MSTAGRARVAIIGAGMAGVTCARLLADAGHAVQLFDKSRGTGGRMATRRARWLACDGLAHESSFDHGAPGFTARSPDFVRFAQQAQRDGLLSRWAPLVAPGSYAPLDGPALWVPTPDMPALCRALLAGVPVNLSRTVEALRRGPNGWCVESAGAIETESAAESFTDVVLAVPPQQAAPLLLAHNPGWAQRAQALTMLPCWTLMGVTDVIDAKGATADARAAPAWDLAWPTQGPLSWIVRNDAKPGRVQTLGLAHWVAHASAPWSQTHLESPAAEVQAALQEALAQWLGQPLTWHQVAVHHWRYASVARADTAASSAATGRCWWDAALGLGVCGDALGGGGVEGAWASGRALASAIADRYRTSSAGAGVPASQRPGQEGLTVHGLLPSPPVGDEHPSGAAPAGPTVAAGHVLPAAVVADLRTDHAGETGAVRIYEGVLSIARDPKLRAFARRHLATEQGHLQLIEAWLPPAQRSRLLPLWRLAGWLTGALPALLGPRAAYGTIEAVERFVDHHYDAQIQRLATQPALRLLQQTLMDCQADEVAHRNEAAAARGATAPGALLRAWAWLVGVGSRGAVAVCRHV